MAIDSPHRPSPAALLRAAKAPAFLVMDPANIRYLTGADVSLGYALVLRRGIHLFVDGRYLEAAHACVRRGTRVLPVQSLREVLGDLRRVGFEAEQVTVARLRGWRRKFKNTKFVQRTNFVEEFRRAKAPDELQHIRRACRITHRILRRIPALLRPGISECALALEIHALALRAGTEGMAFETIVAFGDHTARPHHRPTHRTLRAGDLVQVDMGVKVSGYCSDYSRVFFTGRRSAEQARAYAALLRAKRAAISLVRPGAENHALDRRARAVLQSAGYSKEFCHALGHGLGLEIHEGVSLSQKAPLRRLKKHEVITIEPGLYFEGRWGMRLEDTVIVE